MPTNGLVKMIPASAQVSGGSASVSAGGKVTFTNVGTLNINTCFSTLYDNYMISINPISGSNNNAIYFRLRSGSTDSMINYTVQTFVVNGSALSASRATFQDAGRIANTDVLESGTTLFLFGPRVAEATMCIDRGMGGLNLGSIVDFSCLHNVATAYDGITFYIGSGTMSGTLTIYGFNQ